MKIKGNVHYLKHLSLGNKPKVAGGEVGRGMG